MKNTLYNTVILLILSQVIGCTSSYANSSSYQPTDEVVVLAHGLGRGETAMWRFAKKLESANYKVCRLDYSTIGKSVEKVIEQTNQQIDSCISKAPKVHFVGHSLGGLVIRAYLQNNQEKLKSYNIGNAVFMGTPNKGSELADHLSESWVMKVGGEVSQSLMTGDSSFGNTIEEVNIVMNINIGIIAGTKPSGLTKKHFDGPNDGLVSVESTKLKSMKDFIAIDVEHTSMRNNDEVTKQTIYFLKNAVFKH